MRMLLTALAVLALAAPLPANAETNDTSVVRTDKGLVKGTVTDTHRRFQAIPFAAPPVGPLRWRDPQPAAAWTGTRDATKPAPQCAQVAQFGNPGSTDEDCLYLNVTTPAKPGVKRPVMLWIHGGSFETGSGGFYDARKFVEQTGIVVVTINYRLGAFGNFGYPGLNGSGSFGLADQQAAMRWVQRNARAFGGDPHNVTIFGESAGGISVCGQLTTPRSAGLFHKAIIQSGACSLAFATGSGQFGTIWASRQEVEAIGAKLPLGCPNGSPDGIECLRKVDATKLVDPAIAWQFNRPAYGTRTLPREPSAELKAGRFHRVPVLIGSNRDEATLFIALTYPKLPDTQYRPWIAERFGEAKADEIIRRYPSNGDGDVRPEIAAIETDHTWACRTALDGRLLNRRTPVYRYEFADRTAPMFFPGLPEFPYLAYHASELQFLFDFQTQLTPEQRKLSEFMIGAWGRFASTGTPGWREVIVPALVPGKIAPVDFAAEHQCGFWLGGFWEG
ncbi:carboxylic ester hydrolase [Lentzea sp. NBRC 105346]|uniref:carboxylesterase/lipase family protein n=1 Tax=Lentzea sp. NBRC 105346 TaxID=3032205 RepID=UPI0024A4ABEF|nr:carboxylesterase family protein [Lentzea sp. NBRC 105346]GLZ28360.1 carboxylic ester hydrolase [Lentzea sp. NBRC 105346]